ncbi:MAG: LysM peptidoglycan-binding domain-containing protein [Bacteroidales bacterium]|nr:LysM peptidoglycan-binding domain-containing protein [Bacteroidales bacterium]
MRHTILITVFIIGFLSVLAQKTKHSSKANDYYIDNWTKNLNDLLKNDSNSLINDAKYNEDNLLAISEFHYEKYIGKINSDIEFKYNSRAGAILTNYISNGRKTAKILAYSSYLGKSFDKEIVSLDLPKALKYLPFALSAMNNMALGETGAAGLWQLRYSAARMVGLNIDSYVDERKNIDKSTKAALSEIKHLYSLYKDWDLALAAYSCGASIVNKSIRRANNQMNYDSIYHLLPEFGRDIVPSLTASIILHKYADSLGICNDNSSFAIATDTLEISKRLHFVQLNEVLGISLDTLHFLNPEYKHDIVPAVSELYMLLIPKGYLASFNKYEDSIYSYNDSVLFAISKPVILPPASKSRHYAKYEPEQIPDGSAIIYYTIKSGDNLGYISEWFDIKVRQIEDWNNIYDPRRIRAGKKLKIYVDKDKESYYKKLDTMSFSEKQKREGKTVAPKAKKVVEPLGKDWFYHTVKSGESPYVIAKKYDGVSPEDILRWNNITNARSIQIGQKLKIKKK